MKILAVQNRMGMGDLVIFLPYIEAISKKFNSPVSILVQESSRATDFLQDTKYIDEIIILKKNNKIKNDEHSGIIGSFNLIKDLKKHNFEKIFIFNSSLRYRLISILAGIKQIYQYKLFDKKNQHMIDTAKQFLKKELEIEVKNDARIEISKSFENEILKKINIDKTKTNVLLAIGGSGPTKRIPASTFLKFIEKIADIKKYHFYLATGSSDEEQKILQEFLNSDFKNYFTPLDKFSIKEILPIIKSCKVSICNDTGFGHFSAALEVNTITLMADTPLMYGDYSSKMHPIIPDGEETVSHNTLGKDKINSDKIFKKFLSLTN